MNVKPRRRTRGLGRLGGAHENRARRYRRRPKHSQRHGEEL